MFRKRAKRIDATDYSKPFTVRVVEPRSTYTGKLKYDTVLFEQFSYPEPMLARASQLREQGLQVWTFEPDPSVWQDDRTPYTDKSFSLEDTYTGDNYDYEGEVIPF